MDRAELMLLYDYYGDLLTDRQRECFELRYDQDLSLGDIGQELGISRQGVHDNLARTEALLQNMETKTGCVRRDRACRKSAEAITNYALELVNHTDPMVSEIAQRILTQCAGLKE